MVARRRRVARALLPLQLHHHNKLSAQQACSPPPHPPPPSRRTIFFVPLRLLASAIAPQLVALNLSGRYRITPPLRHGRRTRRVLVP